ncbi:AlpA family phage regulatory protein [Pseudomonadales bacterium]|nr:AlpA family phage regulatory protein [Pseudomonadales bacterium]
MNDNTKPNDLTACKFLRLPEVLTLIPISRSSWYKGIQDGRFPKPVKLSTRTAAWRVEDIEKLISEISEGD